MLKLCVLLSLLFSLGVPARSQNVRVLMLSDLHFDPFHDPAKADRLSRAPVEDWDRILREPDPTLQPERFAALELECLARGVDPDYTLLQASLQAAKAQLAGVVFVTLTGDLLVHGFGCRYGKLLRNRAGYAAFAEKTAIYVMRTVEAAFPGVPVYIAGGNNDSACGDYRLDSPDKYLAATSSAALAGLRDKAAAKRAASDYARNGSFAVMLPGLKRTRLLVLDDIYLADSATGCDGRGNKTGAKAELAWLDRELGEVKLKGEQAWVIGHIPPGINVYSTLVKPGDICHGADIRLLLSSNELEDVLVKHAEVIRLAVFAHTHFDEIRLLGGRIPMKLVPSVSAINGNRPAFTVSEINPETATLEDYSVFEASNTTGNETAWNREYSYREAYEEKDFSGTAVADLVARLQADSAGSTPSTRAYQSHFAPGMLPILSLVWPKYACALSNMTAQSYESCACGAR